MRNNWTREEIMLAFELYCLIPHSQVTIANNRVINLSKAIRRTPSSVKLKMQNFKSFDPSYVSDGRVGLAHGSKLDKVVCDEFLGNWSELVLEVEAIKKKYGLVDEVFDAVAEDEFPQIPIGADKTTQSKIRVGQSFFRRAILSAYNNRCCVTGISIPSILRASHIKPWKHSNDVNEKANPQNGLLLNALHDAAFDKGLITINEDYEIVVSPRINPNTEENKYYFMRYAGERIMLPTRFLPAHEFIKYHNELIFKKVV